MRQTKTTAATCSTPQLSAFLQGFGESHTTREHYTTDVRVSLSRRAKAFLKLMEGQLPDDVMKHLMWELASEARRDQNMLAQQLFNILIDSNQFREPEDERLWQKLDELASTVCCEADLREPVDCDADCDADWM